MRSLTIFPDDQIHQDGRIKSPRVGLTLGPGHPTPEDFTLKTQSNVFRAHYARGV